LNSGTRSNGEAILPIQNIQGLAAETWIGFLSNDEKDAATSVYTSRLEL
jgi:hypothetical protein